MGTLFDLLGIDLWDLLLYLSIGAAIVGAALYFSAGDAAATSQAQPQSSVSDAAVAKALSKYGGQIGTASRL